MSIQLWAVIVIIVLVIFAFFHRDLRKLFGWLRGSSLTHYRKVTGNPEEDRIVWSTDENLDDIESRRAKGIRGSVIKANYGAFQPASRIIGPASKNWGIVIKDATSAEPQIFFSDPCSFSREEALVLIKDYAGIKAMLQAISGLADEAERLRKINKNLEEKVSVRDQQIRNLFAGLEALWRLATTQRRPPTIQNTILKFLKLAQARIFEDWGQEPPMPMEVTVEGWKTSLKRPLPKKLLPAATKSSK